MKQQRGFDIKELLTTISELRAGLKLDARVLLFSNNLELKNQKEYIKSYLQALAR